MITASYMDFNLSDMNPAYREAVIAEKEAQGGFSCYTPFDFGSLDAPMNIAAGSHYFYKYMSLPGGTDMPSSFWRE